ncbi:hypothetical protein HanPI659440_Chr02g0083821 [Helianthus annuus]|nr:hypothetical protein HanPI659440_Chr02g0083821 [Helianthus annuus]
MVENLHHPLLNLNSPFLPQHQAPLALTNQNHYLHMACLTLICQIHCLKVACLTLTRQIHRRPFSSSSFLLSSSDLYPMNSSCLTLPSRESIHQNSYSYQRMNPRTRSSRDTLSPSSSSSSSSSVCLSTPVKV